MTLPFPASWALELHPLPDGAYVCQLICLFLLSSSDTHPEVQEGRASPRLAHEFPAPDAEAGVWWALGECFGVSGTCSLAWLVEWVSIVPVQPKHYREKSSLSHNTISLSTRFSHPEMSISVLTKKIHTRPCRPTTYAQGSLFLQLSGAV